MNTEKISVCKDAAEKEFDRWVDAMRLDLESDVIDENDRRDFAADKNRIVKFIKLGAATVDGEGVLSFTPRQVHAKVPETVTFHGFRGADYLATDYKKVTANVGKLFALMAGIAKCEAQAFAQMDGPDVKFCIAVTQFFLA